MTEGSAWLLVIAGQFASGVVIALGVLIGLRTGFKLLVEELLQRSANVAHRPLDPKSVCGDCGRERRFDLLPP